MKQLLLLMPLVALLFLIGCTDQDQPASKREELPGDSRARLDQTIDRLEEQRAELAARLEEMKAASDEEWEAFKTELEQASEDLQQAFSDLQGALEGAGPQN